MCPAPRVLLLAVLIGAAALPRAQQREMRVTTSPGVSARTETLSSVDALPAHIATSFREPLAFTESVSGQYYVFDRRGQAVYSIDKERTEATRLVQIGPEPGRIVRPRAFAFEPRGSFVVADDPGGGVRIQWFADRGYPLTGFRLSGAGRSVLTVLSGLVSAGGVTSLQFNGDAIYVSRPQTGSLIEEYSWKGQMRRAFGALRATGQESDQAVHLALNAGIPLVDPAGGFYFVFQAGVPLFRKYDSGGTLLFERHIEGRELDPILAAQPAAWPRRRTTEGTEIPAVPLIVQAAAVDPRGNLWVALAEGTVYVYSPDGDKTAALHLRAAGPVAPTSLSFAPGSRLLVTPGCYIFDVAALLR